MAASSDFFSPPLALLVDCCLEASLALLTLLDASDVEVFMVVAVVVAVVVVVVGAMAADVGSLRDAGRVLGGRELLYSFQMTKTKTLRISSPFKAKR